jgi:hypothetical protein
MIKPVIAASPVAQPVTLAARASWPASAPTEAPYGVMFWLMWKRLPGSYFRLT